MAALLCQTFSVHSFSRGTQYRIQNSVLILTGAKTNADRILWNRSDISDNPVHAKPVVYPFSKFFSQHWNILSYVKRKKMT